MLLQEDSNSIVVIPTVRKRKAGAFSSEKDVRIQKATRKSSPGLPQEKEEISFGNSLNQMFSPLCVSSKYCVFRHTWMRLSTRISPNSRKGHLRGLKCISNTLQKTLKLIKNIFLKTKTQILPETKAAAGFICKTTFY